MAYLITCSGSKQIPEIFNPSSLEDLSFNDLLFEARRTLIQLSGIQLNWNLTLPAWMLYSGNHSQLYSQVNPENWIKPCVQVKILSALFGWIKHTDLVPWYNVTMSTELSLINSKVSRYWRELHILNEVIDLHDVDLLFKSYRRVIDVDQKGGPVQPDILFRGRGIQQGIWLNEQLSTLDCGENIME